MKTSKPGFPFMIVIVLLSAAACSPFAPVPTAAPTPVPTVIIQPVDADRTLTINDLERTYYLHIPPGLSSAQPAPLVFVFHGYQENNISIRQATGLDEIANANKFIVAYPNGSGDSSSLSWNGGTCCGYAVAKDVDETAFIHAMLTDIGMLAAVDPKRIYATGFSNGALLSYRLACEMSDTFAAVAPVSGVLVYSPCQPKQPVALMAVNGSLDTVVPIEGGGYNPGTGQPFPAVKDSVETWARLDGCSTEPQVETNGPATHLVYGACRGGAAVELFQIDGMAHFWPSPYAFPVSQMVWNFFATHPKP